MALPIPGTFRRTSPSGERYLIRFDFPGHANRREGIFKRIQRRDSVGGLNINTGATVIQWFNAENFRDGDFFAPINSFPTRVYFLRTGAYRVTYNINAITTGATAASVTAFLSRNGSGNVLLGSMSAAYAGATASVQVCLNASTIVADMTSGDYLEVWIQRASALAGGLTTVASRSVFSADLLSMTDETTLGGKRVIDRPSYIEKVTLTKGVSGFSGSTTVRLLKNGLSTMGSNDMSITSAQTFAEYDQSFFATKVFDVGDIMSLDVISEEAPFPRDLGVVVKMVASNS